MFINKDLVPFVNDIRTGVLGFDDMWDDLVHRPKAYLQGESFPKDNVIHKGDNTLIIELALAGYNKEDITIEREGNFLTINGEKVVEKEDDGVSYVRKNIATRSFTKRYTVSSDYKDIKAEYNNGILRITLEREPKKESSKLIEIS